jgi:hypothetical protein
MTVKKIRRFNMEINQFVVSAKELVADYTNSHTDVSDGEGRLITADDVYVVWYAKTLQNAKALLSTPLPDGMYYEVTLNGDKNEIYFDAYKKFQNIKVEV